MGDNGDSSALMSVNLLEESAYDEEDDAVTPAEVLERLTVAWKDELNAPRILPHRYDVLECIIDQNEGMEENLNRSQRRNDLKISIHRFELQRTQFIANEYLRIRLKKVGFPKLTVIFL
ncbi:hypothetical protein AB6A40_010192 [Gnathostoma spinigerum]|uniref:GINS complex subunit 4 n=1 Tax=Gnathostoma spinigerum TaxID=75299 RepID=A0ABD6EU50_9BILA